MIGVVWLHLLAAVVWIGGSLFLTLVLVPVFRAAGMEGERRVLFHNAARRFRVVVYAAIVALIGTGVVLVQARTGALLEPSRWPAILQIKLALVAGLLALTFVHDLWLGPRAVAWLRSSDRGRGRLFLVSVVPWLARLSLLLALGVLLAAVILARS